VGGIPRGRITTLFGPESGGKTTFALNFLASAQKMGLSGALIDAEQTCSEPYLFSVFENLGAVPELLYLSRPETGTEVMELLTGEDGKGGLIGRVDVIVVDSISSVASNIELDLEPGDSPMGAHARLWSQELKKIIPQLGMAANPKEERVQTAMVFISQVRAKIGIVLGNPEGTTEPNAAKHHASIRARISKKDPIRKSDGKPIGQLIRCAFHKNKVGGVPMAQCFFEILFGKGINAPLDIRWTGIATGVIQMEGNTHLWRDHKWTSKAKAVEAIADPQVGEALRQEVQEAICNS
jgi:recombination protein RecA